MPIAPCATAGSISSVERMARRRIFLAQALRARPAPARSRPHRRAAPWRCRVSTLPRSGTTGRSGRSAFTCACAAQRRGADHGALRQGGDGLPRGRDQHVARILARQQAVDDQAIGQPGRHVLHGMDGADRSRPSSSASSISLVNRPLPPISLNGRSCTLSPVVLMTRSRWRRARPAPDGPRSGRLRVSCAWARASGEPRVPMRRSGRAWLLSGCG